MSASAVTSSGEISVTSSGEISVTSSGALLLRKGISRGEISVVNGSLAVSGAVSLISLVLRSEIAISLTSPLISLVLRGGGGGGGGAFSLVSLVGADGIAPLTWLNIMMNPASVHDALGDKLSSALQPPLGGGELSKLAERTSFLACGGGLARCSEPKLAERARRPLAACSPPPPIASAIHAAATAKGLGPDDDGDGRAWLGPDGDGDGRAWLGLSLSWLLVCRVGKGVWHVAGLDVLTALRGESQSLT